MAASTPPDLSRSLKLAAPLLLLAWVVPDAITDRALFPWQRLGAAAGLDLAALLVPVVGGAAALLVWLGLRAPRVRAVAALLIGDAVVVLPLLGSGPPLALPWWLVLALALVALSIASVRMSRRGSPLAGQALLVALPLALLALALVGVVVDGDPAGYLAAYKAPLVLWAGMQVAAAALAELMVGRTGS